MDKEPILALAEKCGIFPRLTPAGTDEVWSTKRNVESFFDAAIESYKGELLKEAGEPVAKVVSSGAFEVPCLRWTSENASLETLIGTELFTSDQLAAAILKATGPLEEEVERLKRQSANRLIGLCKGGEDNDKLRAQLAKAQEELNDWRNQAHQSQSAFERAQDQLTSAQEEIRSREDFIAMLQETQKDQLAKAEQLWQVAQGRCDGLEEKLAKAEQRVAEWVSVETQLPGEQGFDSEEVLCFLNGHCSITDFECRQGGGWGIRLGYYDADISMFRTHGRPDNFVTHWMPLPKAPNGGNS